MSDVELGDKVKDIITGIVGIVMTRHDYLYGISRIAVQPEGSFEGKPHEMVHLDILQAKVIKKNAVDRHGMLAKKDIPLGSQAVCKITGFKGTCTGRAEWLYACTKVLLQPKTILKETGIPVEAQWLDEPQVKLVKKAKEVVQKTGGYNPNVSSFKTCKR